MIDFAEIENGRLTVIFNCFFLIISEMLHNSKSGNKKYTLENLLSYIKFEMADWR